MCGDHGIEAVDGFLRFATHHRLVQRIVGHKDSSAMQNVE
jgi:hypothetical protein